jgi:hypothetical protein
MWVRIAPQRCAQGSQVKAFERVRRNLQGVDFCLAPFVKFQRADFDSPFPGSNPGATANDFKSLQQNLVS